MARQCASIFNDNLAHCSVLVDVCLHDIRRRIVIDCASPHVCLLLCTSTRLCRDYFPKWALMVAAIVVLPSVFWNKNKVVADVALGMRVTKIAFVVQSKCDYIASLSARHRVSQTWV